MPYIKQEDRQRIDIFVNQLVKKVKSPGELNYAISTLIRGYLLEVIGRVSYSALNEIMGVISCVEREFYRRVVVPYEDKKRKENGDVF